MYKVFFGLKDNPFNVNPDPRYLYFTKEIEEALSGLKYGVQNRKGFITLTGEVGPARPPLSTVFSIGCMVRKSEPLFFSIRG
jgi:general secretion pathway protein A